MASRVDKRKKEIEEAIKEAKRFLEKAQDASVEMNIYATARIMYPLVTLLRMMQFLLICEEPYTKARLLETLMYYTSFSLFSSKSANTALTNSG